MTTWNRIRVDTRDHGPVNVSCPPWCTSDGHPDGIHRVDIGHHGPEVSITVDTVHGPRELLTFALTQYPFSEKPPGTGVFVATHLLDGDHYDFDVAGLERLAADLVEASSKVRRMARRLSVETRGGES